MILTTHVGLAILSIAVSSYNALFPSKTKLYFTYLIMIGTVLSGIMVSLIYPVNLGKVCLSGVFYFGFMILTSHTAQKRLLAQGL